MNLFNMIKLEASVTSVLSELVTPRGYATAHGHLSPQSGGSVTSLILGR